MPTMHHSFPLALVVAEKAMREFVNQWIAGLQPKLSIETSPNGDILVSSNVRAENVFSQARRAVSDHVAAEASGRGHHDHSHQRRKSPSYHRRLRRRAAKRAAATAEKAVQTVKDASRPVPLPPPTNPVPSDELCSDKEYHAVTVGQHHHQQADDLLPHQPHHSIPQLDGNISPNEVQDRVWSCSCCEYKHFFETENELKKHHDTLIFTYEECNICYPWHIWT